MKWRQFCFGLHVLGSIWEGLSLFMMTSSNGNIFRVTGHIVRGIHRWPVNSPHKGQWHGRLMFSLICVWINGWVNNREAGDLRCYRAHYDVIVMCYISRAVSGCAPLFMMNVIKSFSMLLALCAGNSSVTGEFPSQRPVTRSLCIFFDLRLNKWLNKQ